MSRQTPEMLAASSPHNTRPPWELDPLLAEGSTRMRHVEPEAEGAAAGLLWHVSLQEQSVPYHWLGSRLHSGPSNPGSDQMAVKPPPGTECIWWKSPLQLGLQFPRIFCAPDLTCDPHGNRCWYQSTHILPERDRLWEGGSGTPKGKIDWYI